MSIKYIFISLIFTISMAQGEVFLDKNTGKKIQFSKINNLLVDSACSQNKKCMALVKKRSKKKLSLGKINPAVLECYLRNGQTLILRDHENNRYTFCKFKDGSISDPQGYLK